MVTRVLRRFSCKILPFSTKITGLPHSSRRRPMLFRLSQDSTSSSPSTVTMGISPAYKGIPPSCMGMDARFATSMVTTNSEGSICPICRFPMQRITAMRIKYSNTARKYDKIKFATP